MWIREVRHQATTLVGAVPGVHVGRQYIFGGEASTSLVLCLPYEAQSIKGDDPDPSFVD